MAADNREKPIDRASGSTAEMVPLHQERVVMRIAALIVLSLILRGSAFGEEPKPIFEDRSLRDLLVGE